MQLRRSMPGADRHGRTGCENWLRGSDSPLRGEVTATVQTLPTAGSERTRSHQTDWSDSAGDVERCAELNKFETN
jgi:hypothetical protein